MDKLPLEQFVVSVTDQFLRAVEQVEAQHSEWKVGSVELVAHVALKPIEEDDGRVVIYADVNEPARMLHELTIPLIRKTT